MRSGPILALDAATYIGTVAVLLDGKVVEERALAMRGAHEERLMPAVSDALGAAGVRAKDIERVVCGGGPGSFTSLRIAASIAKGVAMAAGAELLTVSSLLLAVTGSDHTREPGVYLATIDAMRGDVFVAAYEVLTDGTVVPRPTPRLVPSSEAAVLASALGARLVGAAREIDATPHARGLARLATPGPLVRAVDLATWEPDYGRMAEAQARWEAAHGPLRAT